MAFPHLGWPEIIIILVIILIIFGAGKLPQVGGAIGKGIRAFRKGQSGEDLEGEEAEKATVKPRRKTTKKSQE